MGLSLLVAFCAGCGNVVATTPIWVVATRMQAEQKRHKDESQSTPLQVAKEIYEESGITVNPYGFKMANKETYNPHLS